MDGAELAELGDLAKLLSKYPVEGPGLSSEGGAKKRKRKGGAQSEWDVGQYDVKDPFVDDSDLAMDEPTHFASSLNGRFFVSVGPIDFSKIDKKGGGGSGKRSASSAAAKAGAEEAAAGPSAAGSAAGAAAAATGAPEPASRIHVAIRDQKTGFTDSINVFLAQRAERKGISVTSISPNHTHAELLAKGKAAAAAAESATTAAAGGSEPPAAGESPMRIGTMLNENGNGTGSAADMSRDVSLSVDPEASRTAKSGSASAAPSRAQEVLEQRNKAKYHAKPVVAPLQEAFDVLKVLVGMADFSEKKKFPPELKRPLVLCAKLAVEVGEYGENYFEHLPGLLPYNRFTLMVGVWTQTDDSSPRTMLIEPSLPHRN